MMASSTDKDDGDQPGASPPTQAPILPASSSQHPTLSSSLPPPPLQHNNQRESQPHTDFVPELNSDRAFDVSLSDLIKFMSVQPPQAPPIAQPAIPAPPEMHPPLQWQHFNQQLPVMGTMSGSQYNGYLGAAPVQDAAHYGILPGVPLPPAGPATGRRRGRPPGSTPKSKPKPKPKAKLAKTAVAASCRPTAATSGEEWPTSDQPDDTSFATIARNACEIEERGEEAVDAGSGDGVEQEVVEYADRNIPGVRFCPSDAEIIGYLRRKYLGHRMPVDFIKDFNIFTDHPSVIKETLGKPTNKSWYVFSPRHRKYANGFRPNRSVGKVGYWKSNAEEAAILFNNIRIGKVNSLTFMSGRQPKGDKTTWKLKEYRIEEYQLKPPSKLLDPWVICKLLNTEDQDETDDESEEHADEANDSGGGDNVDGNQPPNDPEDELDIDEYLALDDFAHVDPSH